MTPAQTAELLGYARAFDPRIQLRVEAVEAWSEILAGRAWPDEARKAVREHYSKPNAFAIMPGDVIGYCDKQPAWSSAEHARACLYVWAGKSYIGILAAYTGVDESVMDALSGASGWGTRSEMADGLTQWVQSNEERLVKEVLRRQHRPMRAQW